MRAAVAIDEDLDPGRGLERATAAAGAALGCDPAALLAFVTASCGVDGRWLADASRRIEAAGPGAVAEVGGLLGEPGELGVRPAVAVVALAPAATGDIGLHAFDHGRGREDEIGEELAAVFATGPGALPRGDALLLLVADGHELDARALAAGLSVPGTPALVGVGVEGRAGHAARFAIAGEAFEAGVLAACLGASTVTRALAPATSLQPAHRLEESRGNWLVRLGGAPALEEFRDAAGALWHDDRRAMQSILVALPFEPGGEPDPAHVRPVVGIDPEQGGVALPEPVEPGERVAFARRDPIAAREALVAAGDELTPGTRACEAPGGATGLGLAVSCRVRGEALFGHPGIESAYLSRAFSGAPWLGLVGSYQLAGRGAGPGSPRVDLLTHTAALARLA